MEINVIVYVSIVATILVWILATEDRKASFGMDLRGVKLIVGIVILIVLTLIWGGIFWW